MRRNLLYTDILQIQVDKSNIISIVDRNDCVNGDRIQWCRDIIDNNHRYVSFFLSETSKYFDLDKIKVVFDVGSLNGMESVWFTQLLKDAKIYSFEANPSTYLNVSDNQKNYKNANCFNLAISDFVGETDFYITTENIGASSILKPMGGYAGTSYEIINADATTIKEFSINNNVDNIDILWMDLQGSELRALKGMGDMLKTTKIICSEVGLKPYYEGHNLYDEICNYLYEYGFEISKTEYPFTYTRDMDSYECDFIFINKNLIEK